MPPNLAYLSPGKTSPPPNVSLTTAHPMALEGWGKGRRAPCACGLQVALTSAPFCVST